LRWEYGTVPVAFSTMDTVPYLQTLRVGLKHGMGRDCVASLDNFSALKNRLGLRLMLWLGLELG